jgi:hypothetical protein
MMDGASLFFTYKDKDIIKFFRHLSGYISFYCVSCTHKNFWYWACTAAIVHTRSQA